MLGPTILKITGVVLETMARYAEMVGVTDEARNQRDVCQRVAGDGMRNQELSPLGKADYHADVAESFPRSGSGISLFQQS